MEQQNEKEAQLAQAEEAVEELDLNKLREDIVKETTEIFKSELSSLTETVNKLSEQVKKKQVLIKNSVNNVNTDQVKDDLESWFTPDILKAVKSGTSISLAGLKKVK